MQLYTDRVRVSARIVNFEPMWKQTIDRPIQEYRKMQYNYFILCTVKSLGDWRPYYQN